jgi:hypothetical protein
MQQEDMLRMEARVKTINSSGQTVTVEQIEDGVCLVRTAREIPNNKLWLHEPAVKKTVHRAVQRVEKNPAAGSERR